MISASPILHYSVVGPHSDGYYRVVYSCGHIHNLTVVCEMHDWGIAKQEAERLNQGMTAKTRATQETCRPCKLPRISVRQDLSLQG